MDILSIWNRLVSYNFFFPLFSKNLSKFSFFFEVYPVVYFNQVRHVFVYGSGTNDAHSMGSRSS